MIVNKINKYIYACKNKMIFKRDKMRIKLYDPIFNNYRSESKVWTKKVKPAYFEYVNNISSPEMAVSLQTAVLLYYLSKMKCPKRILDLGSGFSSYILRLYAHEHSENVEVYSIDDNNKWLEKTQKYLSINKLPSDNLKSLESFNFRSHVNSFDLVFHDLGNMNLRKKHLIDAVSVCKTTNGIVILDDIHKEDYKNFIRSVIPRYRCNYYNLNWITRDDFGRRAALLTNINISNFQAQNETCFL